MTAEQTPMSYDQQRTRASLADFKSWWANASAEDQQRWWTANADRLAELDERRQADDRPWTVPARVLELEEENARLAAALEEAKAPKQGTNGPTYTVETTAWAADAATIAEQIRKGIESVMKAYGRPREIRYPTGKAKPLATTLGELWNGPQVYSGQPALVWIGVPRGDDGAAGQPAALPTQPPKQPIVTTCADPACPGHLRADVARLYVGDGVLDPAQERAIIALLRASGNV